MRWVSGPPPTAEADSAVRARDLLARTSLRERVSFDGPVLLVDDTARTQGTVTVASALLAEVGEPGDAARRPPAPMSAIRGRRAIHRSRSGRLIYASRVFAVLSFDASGFDLRSGSRPMFWVGPKSTEVLSTTSGESL
jgi:hypothetical protein